MYMIMGRSICRAGTKHKMGTGIWPYFVLFQPVRLRWIRVERLLIGAAG
jgi:hypothetical protein